MFDVLSFDIKCESKSCTRFLTTLKKHNIPYIKLKSANKLYWLKFSINYDSKFLNVFYKVEENIINKHYNESGYGYCYIKTDDGHITGMEGNFTVSELMFEISNRQIINDASFMIVA